MPRDRRLQAIRLVLADGFRDFELSPRERQAANLAARGATTYEIAERLGITANTVSNILDRVRTKTGMAKSEMPAHLVRQIEEVVR